MTFVEKRFFGVLPRCPTCFWKNTCTRRKTVFWHHHTDFHAGIVGKPPSPSCMGGGHFSLAHRRRQSRSGARGVQPSSTRAVCKWFAAQGIYTEGVAYTGGAASCASSTCSAHLVLRSVCVNGLREGVDRCHAVREARVGLAELVVHGNLILKASSVIRINPCEEAIVRGFVFDP